MNDKKAIKKYAFCLYEDGDTDKETLQQVSLILEEEEAWAPLKKVIDDYKRHYPDDYLGDQNLGRLHLYTNNEIVAYENFKEAYRKCPNQKQKDKFKAIINQLYYNTKEYH